MFLPHSGYSNTLFPHNISPSRSNEPQFEGFFRKRKKPPLSPPKPDTKMVIPPVGSLDGPESEKKLPDQKPQFLDLMNRPDRKPTYWRNSPRNIVIALMAGFGFAVSADAVKKFHHWSDETAIALKNSKNTPPSQQKGDLTQVQLPPLAPKSPHPKAEISHPQPLEEVNGEIKSEPPIIDSDGWDVILKQVPSKEEVLNGIAKTDHTLHHTPVVGYMMDLYVNLIRWEALTIAILAFLVARKRTITPTQLWSELNRRGVQGEGLKVAVISSGGKPSSGFCQDKMKVINPEDQKKTGLGWVVPGSQVVNLIAEASPKSTYLIFPAVTRSNAKEIFKKANAIFNKAKENPEKLDMNEVRMVYQPIIQNMANAVRRAVDEKANVVHIAFNLEQMALVYLFYRLALTYRDMKLLKTKKLFLPRWTQAAKRNAEKIARYETLFQKSKDLIKAHKHTQTIGEEFRKLYQPLKEALDYAYAHEVPVIVPAGNYGGHKGVEADVIGNVNPMSIINHPGLIVVGSTNSKGVISDFTSEFNDEIRPFIGGMGSDEVMSSKASVLKRAWGQKFLFPLGGILGNYLRGISMAAFSRPLWMQILGPLGGVGTQMIMGENKGGIFAAPDVTLLYLKMKEIDPNLTIEEAKSMMLQAAAKAEFSPKHLKKIEAEIAQCGKTTARNYSHGLIDNVMTGVQAAVLSGKKTLRLRCEMGNIKIQRVHHHHQDHLKIRFLSYIDQERLRIELPLEGLENLQHTGYKPLLEWLQGIVKKEDSKLEKLSPQDKQKKLLQMELGRRVGNGTIAGKRYQIIAMTEQARLAKEKHALLEQNTLKPQQSDFIPHETGTIIGNDPVSSLHS